MPDGDLKAPTLDDIAAKVGVSRMTVSRALNGTGPVAAATKARILDVSRRLGYSAAKKARTSSLKKQVTVLRYQCPPATPDPYFDDVFEGIRQGLDHFGYRAVPHFLTPQSQSEKPFEIDEDLAGVVVVGPGLSPQLLHDVKVPIVTVAWHTPLLRSSAVMADNVGGTWTALDYLFSRGRDQVALITGPTDHPEIHERIVGFHAYHGMKGLNVNPSWVRTSDYTNEANQKAIESLFASRSHPNAIFCTCGSIAASAVEMVEAHGLSAQGDITVLSFDDDDHVVMPPWVSKVKVDRKRMGIVAAELLHRSIRASLFSGMKVIVPVRLVPGYM